MSGTDKNAWEVQIFRKKESWLFPGSEGGAVSTMWTCLQGNDFGGNQQFMSSMCCELCAPKYFSQMSKFIV